MSFNSLKELALLFIMKRLLLLATATLLVKPQNASASEGHRVQLNCSTDSVGRPINWRNISVAEGDSEVDIFLNGTFVNGYDDRFQMDVDKAKGVYNLVIPSVQLRDAGTYRCRDKDGAGLYDDAILNVTGNCNIDLLFREKKALPRSLESVMFRSISTFVSSFLCISSEEHFCFMSFSEQD